MVATTRWEAVNTTGFRSICLSKISTSATIHSQHGNGTGNILNTMLPISGGNCTQYINGIMNINSENTTVYLHVVQNSGSTLETVFNSIVAFKIMDYRL